MSAHLPPHPQPPWPTAEVVEALKGPHDFAQFDTWKDLFLLAQKHNRHLYVTQFLRGCPTSRYQVASVAPTATATDCPVVLFNAGGLFGDDFGNLGGSLVLKFEPPIQRTIIDRFQFAEPEIR
jgi:hypothetical protein